MSPKLSKKELADRIQALCVLVVDDNQYMRKMIRNHLVFGICPPERRYLRAFLEC
jgi:hypothetical protein